MHSRCVFFLQILSKTYILLKKQSLTSTVGIISEIEDLFRAFDKDNSNTISVAELKKAMNFLGLAPTNKEVQLAMKQIDKNGMHLSYYFVPKNQTRRLYSRLASYI